MSKKKTSELSAYERAQAEIARIKKAETERDRQLNIIKDAEFVAWGAGFNTQHSSLMRDALAAAMNILEEDNFEIEDLQVKLGEAQENLRSVLLWLTDEYERCADGEACERFFDKLPVEIAACCHEYGVTLKAKKE